MNIYVTKTIFLVFLNSNYWWICFGND